MARTEATYPRRDAQPAYELAGLQIRHLELDVSRMAPLSRGVPVEALVFPRYQRGVGLEQRRLTATEALARLFHVHSKLDLRPDFLAETLKRQAADFRPWSSKRDGPIACR